MKKSANSFLEYAVVLGIVSLVLVGMNIYMKRGFQGKLKDLADNFISREQIGDPDPTVLSESNSSTQTISGGSADREILAGGQIKTESSDSAIIEASRKTITQAEPLPGQFTPAEAGMVTTPVRDDNGGQEQ